MTSTAQGEPASDRVSRRFTRIVVAILVAGLATTAAVALLVDPFRVFGTARIPAEVVNEREAKPQLFLAAPQPPEAVILGSSRVYKINPACVTELTGLRAFNFGVGNGNTEDWYAITRFVNDHTRTPIRELLIGCDVDAFDTHFDHRLEMASQLREYVGYSGVSWSSATRALFGQDAFQYGLRSVWFYLRPGDRGEPNYFGPDGFEFTPERDAQIRNGTYAFEQATNEQIKRIKRLASDPFDALTPERVERFRTMVRAAHANGVTIDVFITPMSAPLAAARAFSQIPKREAELDAMLRDLEREGTLRYHPLKDFEDLGSDPKGFYDGAHMREATATRLLLRMFHREHGCGL